MPPLRQAPFTSYPSSRPWRETRRALGNPPVSICPVRKFFQKMSPGKKTPRGRDPPQFFTQQNPAGLPRLEGRFRDFSGGPLRTPLVHPNRCFLVPMMAVSPLNRTLIRPEKVVTEWIILAAYSDRPEAFHRDIIHTGFEGNPRFSGRIGMQLSKEYRNNSFWHGVAGRWQVAKSLHLLNVPL
jgi:hypothetical protein